MSRGPARPGARSGTRLGHLLAPAAATRHGTAAASMVPTCSYQAFTSSPSLRRPWSPRRPRTERRTRCCPRGSPIPCAARPFSLASVLTFSNCVEAMPPTRRRQDPNSPLHAGVALTYGSRSTPTWSWVSAPTGPPMPSGRPRVAREAGQADSVGSPSSPGPPPEALSPGTPGHPPRPPAHPPASTARGRGQPPPQSRPPPARRLVTELGALSLEASRLGGDDPPGSS